MEDYIAFGLLWYVVFLFSTVCHEAAHAWVAKLGGDLTAFHGGQVSLDPMPHIRREPFGMILFPILSYATAGWMMGWASAPYDPYWAQRHPKRAAWMSLAGPCANFALVLVAAAGIHIGIQAGIFEHPNSINFSRIVAARAEGLPTLGADFLSVLFSLNLLLGTFNLVPVPPLDGFSVLGLFMSEESARKLEAMGQQIAPYAFLGLIVAWQVFDHLYSPIFSFALTLLYPSVGYEP